MNIIGSLLNLAKVVLDPDEEKELISELQRTLEDDIDTALRKDEPFEVDDVKWTWDKGQKGGWDDPSWPPYVDEITYDMPNKWLIEWKDLDKHDISDMDAAEKAAIYKKVLTPFHKIKMDDVIFEFGDLGKRECKLVITHAEPTLKGIEVKIDVEVDDEELREVAQRYDEKYRDD